MKKFVVAVPENREELFRKILEDLGFTPTEDGEIDAFWDGVQETVSAVQAGKMKSRPAKAFLHELRG